MYPVSSAFLEAVKANTRKYYWTGRITTTAGTVYEFDQDDMVKGSGYITSQCCESTEIELGTVYAAEMGISLFSEINWYTLEDAKVELAAFSADDNLGKVVVAGVVDALLTVRPSVNLPASHKLRLHLHEDFLGNDGLVGEAFLTKLSDTLGLRHELLQTLEQLIQLRLLGKHLFNKRSAVRNLIGERSFAVRQWIIKRDGRVVVEFAVEAVAVAQPPFAARAEALVAILHSLAKSSAPAVVLAILVLQDFVPLLCGLVIDAFTLIVIGFHVRYLRSLLPNRRPHKKERDRPDGTGINSFRSASHARRLVSYSFVTATTARATLHAG